MSVYTLCVPGDCRGWKWVPDPLKLELGMGVSCWSPVSITRVHDCCAISPAPLAILFAMQVGKNCCLASWMLGDCTSVPHSTEHG